MVFPCFPPICSVFSSCRWRGFSPPKSGQPFLGPIRPGVPDDLIFWDQVRCFWTHQITSKIRWLDPWILGASIWLGMSLVFETYLGLRQTCARHVSLCGVIYHGWWENTGSHNLCNNSCSFLGTPLVMLDRYKPGLEVLPLVRRHLRKGQLKKRNKRKLAVQFSRSGC